MLHSAFPLDGNTQCIVHLCVHAKQAHFENV